MIYGPSLEAPVPPFLALQLLAAASTATLALPPDSTLRAIRYEFAVAAPSAAGRAVPRTSSCSHAVNVSRSRLMSSHDR